MPEDAQNALTTLQNEAKAFMDGKRAQGDMFQEAA